MSAKDALEQAQKFDDKVVIPNGDNVDHYQKVVTAIEGKALNYELKVERDGKDLDDHIALREAIKLQCKEDRKNLIAQVFVDYRDTHYKAAALVDVSDDSSGEFELRRRLRRQFGPGYKVEPQPKAVLESFYGVVLMDQDIQVLREVKLSGKDAVDLLNPTKKGG